ncbi:hypothetical protein HMF7854_12980 [Sphingomonas ginkgonis]|uniref:Porin n=1 Tax=Sphingomonas ginkgonis TaxID=2315330 RepID=A0A3R9Z7E7_9SPHN|nr:TorF family putative porin [Sphingomonas ginkgonis]RST31645.1 hypothetical protein HMF7854_12980 [Sphingomonas ginkgonis]
MRLFLGVPALLLVMSSAPAEAADLGGGFAVSGGAAIVTDYRFRGISQTNRRFAIQGTGTLSHSSGFYATFWGSSIDDYIANGGDAELDLIAGYKHTTKGGTTFDGGVLYYYYPGSGGANTDFVEPYVSVAQAFGPVTAKVTANYAPKQHGIAAAHARDDNLYLAGDLSYAVPKTSLSLTGHLGHSWGPSYLTAPYRHYTDWNVGAAYALKNLTFGLSYVDTDKHFESPSGRSIGGAGVVGSVGVSF